MAQGGNGQSEQERDPETEGDAVAAPRDEGFWREMWHQMRLVWFLIRDPEVPFYLKVLPLAAFIYILIPTDFIPDVFPVVGQLDDLTALIVGGKVFIELAPQRVVAEHIRSMQSRAQGSAPESVENGTTAATSGDDTGIVIEGEFEEVDQNEDDQAA
jgi:uncharacterized membrane protein YkvA (DUF1232 family)